MVEAWHDPIGRIRELEREIARLREELAEARSEK